MKTLLLNISLDELLESPKKPPKKDKEAIRSFLGTELSNEVVSEPDLVYTLSEKSLEKDWLKEEEDQAWKDLQKVTLF